MYGALWRLLPGPWWVKLPILLLLIAAVVWALFTYVFPQVSLWMTPPDTDVIINE